MDSDTTAFVVKGPFCYYCAVVVVAMAVLRGALLQLCCYVCCFNQALLAMAVAAVAVIRYCSDATSAADAYR